MDENPENKENQLLLKQELLKNQIVSKNYDPSKFLQFCLYQKENGDDMNNWTYEELKQCVEKFIESEKQKEENNLKKKDKDSKNNSEKSSELSNKDNLNKNKNEIKEGELDTHSMINKDIKENEDHIFEKKIHELTCKTLEKNILNNKELKVTIKNPKTNEKTLLTSSYVNYEVFTEPSCWSVRRRFSDFSLLRQILRKYYPRMVIPPLPEKKSGNKRFKQEFIDRRMKFLQIFINDIIKNEEFRANEALPVFLNFNDHNQFEKKMKELNNYIPPSNFDEVKTLTGKLNVLDNDYDVDKYLTNINNYCKSQKQIFNKLNINLKSYCRHISSACQNLEEISKSFEEMHNLNLEIEIKEEIPKTYNILSYFFKEWKQIMSKENEIIHSKIKGFFKLQRLVNNAYIEIADSRENIKQKYTTENNKLYTKKEKLYSIKDINKWEIINIENLDKPLLLRDKNYAFDHMCEKDSLYVNNLYKHLIYANYMNFSEFEKNVNINIKAYVDNTKEFAKLIFPYINASMNLWQKLNKYI